MACRPATPAPSTRTFAGRLVPAAVISIGKNRPKWSAATSTALYPATLAWEVSASIDWARLTVRGRPSRLMAVTPARASRPASSGWTSGRSRPMTTWPARSRVISADVGEHAGPVGHVLPAGDRRAGSFVGAVGKPRRRSCFRLDQNPDARAGQHRDRLGYHRHPLLAGGGLLHYADRDGRLQWGLVHGCHSSQKQGPGLLGTSAGYPSRSRTATTPWTCQTRRTRS